MSLQLAWDEARFGLGLGRDDEALVDLRARYGEAHRRYHGLGHVEACLAIFDGVRGLAARPAEVAMALFFHDAIYVPFAADNEARSAELATAVLARGGLDEETCTRIDQAIRATRHVDAQVDGDAALVLDIDLSILAASPAAFDAYEAGVRAEYAAIDDAGFAAGRAAFVRSMLARERLFLTPELHARWDALARSNLRRSLLRWS